MQHTNLFGTVPTEIGLLTNLHELRLSNNYLSGTIPSEIGHMSELRYLYMGYNYLSGTVPQEICEIDILFSAHTVFACNIICSCCGHCISR
mmetsp:Transcript_8278/g.14178  ORF Transcript_8278/g.14178 Transcript_8278/m.14178 type:complete len:91 (+) Transcript_8278:546-818(+)